MTYPNEFAFYSRTPFEQTGLTKRELFAIGILNGLLSNPHHTLIGPKMLVGWAAEIADQFIDALNEPVEHVYAERAEEGAE